jgi:hypothetical protein
VKLVAATASWLALIGGLGPATAYAFTVIIGIVWILYFRVALLLAIRGWIPRFNAWTEAVISVGFVAVCDVGLIYLLVQFWRFKSTWKDQMRGK